MISITRLYGDGELRFAGDPLRYSLHGATKDRSPRPVVVWNCTRRCNLACVHCYSSSDARPDPNELTTRQAKDMIDDLAGFDIPALLFSGGEPLLRNDLDELLRHASHRRLRTVISTNGTRITPDVARRLASVPVGYVGVSLDAAEAEQNDAFRGRVGAFEQAMAGIHACRDAGIKVGVRFTMTRRNLGEIPALFDLVERQGIERVCFYHFVLAGRGEDNASDMPSLKQTREAMDLILHRTRALLAAGRRGEVLTVGNHADGPYLYLQLLRENPAQAAETLRLLRCNGGNRSGIAIASISWDGAVHPDQFWRSRTVGNVRVAPFSEIWSHPEDGSLLDQLRQRGAYLRGRCERCRFLDLCNGNLRVRAEAAGNGLWGDDPACYLTDEDIRREEDR